MSTKETKPAPLRLTVDDMETLRKEAQAQFRTLAGYLQMLVLTHPGRKKKVKKQEARFV